MRDNRKPFGFMDRVRAACRYLPEPFTAVDVIAVMNRMEGPQASRHAITAALCNGQVIGWLTVVNRSRPGLHFKPSSYERGPRFNELLNPEIAVPTLIDESEALRPIEKNWRSFRASLDIRLPSIDFTWARSFPMPTNQT